ncbi:hypothetical protein Tco_1534655 [Tanacetum coccineum]
MRNFISRTGGKPNRSSGNTCSIGPGSFLPLILLLVIVVVSVAVVVVVVGVTVVVVVGVGVSLVVFPFPLISSSFQWAPIQDTSRPAHGNDCCMPRCHLLSESESKVLVPSFRFQLLGSIQWSS